MSSRNHWYALWTNLCPYGQTTANQRPDMMTTVPKQPKPQKDYRETRLQTRLNLTLVAHSLWSKFILSTTPIKAKLCSNVLFSLDAISQTKRAVSCRSAVSFSTEFMVAEAKLTFLGSLHLKIKKKFI